MNKLILSFLENVTYRYREWIHRSDPYDVWISEGWPFKCLVEMKHHELENLNPPTQLWPWVREFLVPTSTQRIRVKPLDHSALVSRFPRPVAEISIDVTC